MRATAAWMGAATAKSMSATKAGITSGGCRCHLLLRRLRSADSLSSNSMGMVFVCLLKDCRRRQPIWSAAKAKCLSAGVREALVLAPSPLVGEGV
jgi:hypothetical protein